MSLNTNVTSTAIIAWKTRSKYQSNVISAINGGQSMNKSLSNMKLNHLNVKISDQNV